MPRSRQHGNRAFSCVCPPRQDSQRCHGPVTAWEAALWCRSPHRLAQVPGHPGAGPKKWWSPAPRNCFQCFPVAQDSKRKTDLLRLAGGPAPPAEGTCATGRGDLRRKKGGPAPPGEGTAATRRKTCATGRGDLRRKEDRRRREKGLAPKERGTCATGRGDLRREKGPPPPGGRPAPPAEGSGATGRGDLRRKEDRRHQKEDLRHQQKGPAPRNCFQCFPVAQDSKRKTDLLLRGRT